MPVIGTAKPSSKPPEWDSSPGRYEVRTFWIVLSDSVLDGPQTIVSAPGLPEFGSTYVWGNDEPNPYLRARDYSAKPIGSSPMRSWEVTVTYKTPERKEYSRGEQASGAGPGTGTESTGEFLNPLLELPTAKIHFAQREVLITQIYDTITGIMKPVTASNGEVYDPPPKRIQNYMILEITRNEPISQAQATQYGVPYFPHPQTGNIYGNLTNTDNFWTLGPGYWKAKEINPESQNRQIPGGTIFPFLRVTYSFEQNPDTWALQVLDYGTVEWVQPPNQPFAPQRTNITTREARPTAAPLDGKGNKLPDRVLFTSFGQTPGVPGLVKTYATTPAITFVNGQMVQVSSLGASGQLPQGMNEQQAFYVANAQLAQPPYQQQFSLSSDAAGTRFPSFGPTVNVPNSKTFIWACAVFFTVYPYGSTAFAPLKLPADFSQCQ